MSDDTVDIVVTVPRQVAEKAKAALAGMHTAQEYRASADSLEAAGIGDSPLLSYHDRVNAALLETDLTPPPDVVVVDGVRLTEAADEAVTMVQRHRDGVLTAWRTGALADGQLIHSANLALQCARHTARIVRDALLAQEAEPRRHDYDPDPSDPLADECMKCGRPRTAHKGTT